MECAQMMWLKIRAAVDETTTVVEVVVDRPMIIPGELKHGAQVR